MFSTMGKNLVEYYKSQENPDRLNPVISEVKKITMGWETELYSFVLEYEKAGCLLKTGRVIRLYSGNSAAEKALKEFKVMNWLLDAKYPVPKVFHVETSPDVFGKPFIIMEKIEGCNMMESLLKASQEEKRSLVTLFVQSFVDLHNLKVPRVLSPKNTREYLSQIISLARENLSDCNISWLEPVLKWIEERMGNISSERLSLLHRDFHPNNIMLRNDGSPVIVDWGASTIGDYRDDLGWTVLLGVTYLGSDFREATLNLYERLSGRKIRDVEFFEVIAMFRRLEDLLVSVMKGPEKMGMRSGAIELMRRNSEHFHKVYTLLKERTGLRILELERFLSTL